MPEKNKEIIALVVTALFFGAVHIHVGIYYMFGAALLLGALGFIYIKQKSIWGTCIPHYVLGLSLVALGIV